MSATLLLLAMMAATGLPSPPKVAVLLAIDEAVKDASLLAVRQEIIYALRHHDLQTVMANVADDFNPYNNGGGKGALQANLSIEWNTPNPFANSLADDLLAASTLGGTFTVTRGSVAGERQFCAPYVYSAFPKKFQELEEREDLPWVIIAKDVREEETEPHSPNHQASQLPRHLRQSCRVVWRWNLAWSGRAGKAGRVHSRQHRARPRRLSRVLRASTRHVEDHRDQ